MQWVSHLARLLQGCEAQRRICVFYDPAYRLPLPALEDSMDLRRADLAAWYLVGQRTVAAGDLRTPPPIPYRDLARVHTPDYLESLARPDTLARIFGVLPAVVPVDALLKAVRLAAGGTLAAAREALGSPGATLNLLGGFHHAAPARGGGLCAVNDIAVAIAVLRATDSFTGKVAVLDLDAHPPDGTAECVRGDTSVWLGSLSASGWGRLEGIDETLVREGCEDAEYLEALTALLSRMPETELTFVVAGGDVVRGDRFGRLALTVEGVRQRDLAVIQALGGRPSVWLPGGGYHPDAWKVLAGTGLALAGCSGHEIPEDYDPVTGRFAAISAGFAVEDLQIGTEDLEKELQNRGRHEHALLGYYGPEGVEMALSRFGVMDYLERLGYHDFRIDVSAGVGPGDRFRLYARHDAQEHMLVECVLGKERFGEAELLYVHWLLLRNPCAPFAPGKPALPGQDTPGLGLLREAGAVFARIAERLGLAGVALRPAWYHTAFLGRKLMRFVDPVVQGRFEALQRDLSQLPLGEASTAIADGRVRMNGEPYQWQPELMVWWRDRPADPAELAEAALERARVRFTLEDMVAQEESHG